MLVAGSHWSTSLCDLMKGYGTMQCHAPTSRRPWSINFIKHEEWFEQWMKKIDIQRVSINNDWVSTTVLLWHKRGFIIKEFQFYWGWSWKKELLHRGSYSSYMGYRVAGTESKKMTTKLLPCPPFIPPAGENPDPSKVPSGFSEPTQQSRRKSGAWAGFDP